MNFKDGHRASLSFLACSSCGSDLVGERNAFICTACGRAFPLVLSIPDFRLFHKRKCWDDLLSVPEEELTSRLLEAYPTSSFRRLVDIYHRFYRLPEPMQAISFDYHLCSEKKFTYLLQHINSIKAASGFSDPGKDLAVDLGCGSGGWAVLLSEEYRHVVGIDPSLPSLILAKKRIEETGRGNVTLVCAYGEAIPMKERCADFVTMCDVVEHVQSLGEVLRQVRRVLRERAAVFLNSPNRFAPLLIEPHVSLWGVGFLPRSLAELYVRMRRGLSYRHVARMHSYGTLMRNVWRTFGTEVFHYAYYEARFSVSKNPKARLLRAVLFTKGLRRLFWGLMRRLEPHCELLIRKASRSRGG